MRTIGADGGWTLVGTPRPCRHGTHVPLGTRRASGTVGVAGGYPTATEAVLTVKMLRAVLVASALFVGGASLVQAASCNGASHQLSLTAGRANPGSGAPGTSFTFSVTYRDTGNCVPNYVRVQVAGVGTFAMTGGGTDYDGGVRFTRSVSITDPGNHAYLFLASSGSGNGQQNIQLTNVQPSRVTVESPPTPKPTAKPTPKPTVAPTSVPRPTATARPTRRPTPSPAATAVERPRPTRAPSATATPAAIAGPGSTNRPGGYRHLPLPRPELLDAIDPFGFDLHPTIARLGQWAALTVAGLGALLLLSARRQRDEDPGTAVPTGFLPPHGRTEARERGDEPSPNARSLERGSRRDEANMPRWLRPSVQAGREGRLLDD